MIISKTPIRITFLGGGTDYPEYFKYYDGFTLGMSINKYSKIIIEKSTFLSNSKYQVHYSKVENVDNLSEIAHPSARECLKFLNQKNGIQIHYTSELPAKTGLGSSSSFTVGLLNALYTYNNQKISKEEIAKKAVFVEQKLIKERVGCQDQFTCSIGGFLFIQYSKKGIIPNTVNLSKVKIDNLTDHLVLIYTGVKRFAHEVLKEQIVKTKAGHLNNYLNEMKTLTIEAKSIIENYDIIEFGRIINEGWQLKKGFSKSITNEKIDNIYNKALKNGAIGGKLLGAGGGGFLLFVVPKEKKKKLIDALKPYKSIAFKAENSGSTIIFNDSRNNE